MRYLTVEDDIAQRQDDGEGVGSSRLCIVSMNIRKPKGRKQYGPSKDSAQEMRLNRLDLVLGVWFCSIQYRVFLHM